MGWWIALGILVVLALFPLGVSLRYENQAFIMKILAGGIPISLNLSKPKKKKPEKPRKEERPEEKTANPNAPRAPKPKKDLSVFLPWIRLGLDLLGDLRRKLVIDWLQLNLILGGSDPCDLGVLYGRIWAAAGNLLPSLDNLLVIRKRDISINCDFTAEKTLAEARVDLHLTLGRAAALIARYGYRALKELFAMKSRKGGASK